MSTPPVASRADAKVADAAVLMLKFKVHRIPIVDGDAKVVGIVRPPLPPPPPRPRARTRSYTPT